MSAGKQALVRVLDQLRQPTEGEDVDTLVERIWPDFVTAVAGARGELREAELEGVIRWREERHKGKQ